MRILRNSVAVLALALTYASEAPAGLIVTIEPPGQQVASASILGQQVQTFENLSQGGYSNPLVTTVGTGSSAFTATYASQTSNPFWILGHDVYGGAGGRGNYIVAGLGKGTTSLALTLSVSQAYFGFWWSAGDYSNSLSFYSGNQLIGTFTTNSSFFTNLSKTYYGNPNSTNNSADSGEPFAFINFFGTAGTTFDRIIFNNSHNTGFESDNHTFSSVQQAIIGTQIESLASTPEPSTILSAAVAAILTAAWLARQKKQQFSYS